MLLGIYNIYLNCVSNLYLPILIPIGIGILLGSFCFMKLTKFLLDNYYAITFYSIIGFTFGSIFVLLPELTSLLDFIIAIMCSILGFYLIFLLNFSHKSY